MTYEHVSGVPGGVLEWPWCRSHDAPMIATGEGWICYWAGKPTLRDEPGCEAKTSLISHSDRPYSLTWGLMQQCDHNWVSAVNKIIESGEMCTKCLSVRASDGRMDS